MEKQFYYIYKFNMNFCLLCIYFILKLYIITMIIRLIMFCHIIFLLVVSISYYVHLKCVFDVLNVNSLFNVYFERDVILFMLLNSSFYS